MRAWMCIALAALVTVAGCGNKGSGQKPQPKRVIVYYSVDQQYAEPVLKAFQDKTGIEVITRGDTEATKTVGLVGRLETERDKPRADVFWSSEVFHTIRLADDGLLADDCPDPMVDRPAWLSGAQGRWRGFALRARVICYATERVPKDQAPTCLTDLLDPTWKGRVVMADPRAGTTSGCVASWFVHYGPDRAKEILAGLKANGVRLVDGNSAAVRMVATGQADVCLTDTDDVYAGQRNGWPIAANPLDLGTHEAPAGSLAIPNTVSIVKGAPHAEAAAQLAEFLLSAEVAEMMARSDSHNSPVRPDLADRFPDFRIARPLPIDYGRVAAAVKTAPETAWEMLR